MKCYIGPKGPWLKREKKLKTNSVSVGGGGIFKMQRLTRTSEDDLQQEELLLKHHHRESQRNVTTLKINVFKSSLEEKQRSEGSYLGT